MNAQPQKKPRMTPEKYLQFDHDSDIKYEYFDGDVFAMTGGSLNHNQISINIASQLKSTLRGSPCRPLASDMRVKVNEIDKYTYPDIVVVCGNIELEKVKGVETLLNPVVIIEILSDSTEAYDRGKKFTHYRLIPSLREYILVSQDYCNVEQFSRGDRGIWHILDPCMDMERSITIESIDCELLLSDIYELVDFETDSDSNRDMTPHH
jgi:Uma2 family endonuclease